MVYRNAIQKETFPIMYELVKIQIGLVKSTLYLECYFQNMKEDFALFTRPTIIMLYFAKFVKQSEKRVHDKYSMSTF